MKKKGSIKTKLIMNIMIMISVIFIILMILATVVNIHTVNTNIAKSEKSIRDGIIAKGKTLAQNNSMAMRSMVVDYAFTAIQALVSSTVKEDKGILYGIYMDENLVPWVFSHPENIDGIPVEKKPLTDSMSQWASGIKEVSYREHIMFNEPVIEFAAPVLDEDEIVGFIRYGLTTKAMRDLLDETRLDGKKQRDQANLFLIAVLLLSLGTGYLIIRRVATAITTPIARLVTSSEIISQGDYSKEVTVESNDEIGNLATHFEKMRKTIEKYTNHLQDLVDEKMQQVRDILDNINQGLFTINMDGSINEEYSARANDILKVKNVAKSTLSSILRLDADRTKAFKTWLELVHSRYKSLRWEKLTKLAPVQQLILRSPEKEDMDYVAISYQKIFDKAGNLSKIMILALDETEKHLKDIQIKEEQRRHDNEMKTILGIADTPAEEMAEFMEDTHMRLERIQKKTSYLLKKVIKQRNEHPDGFMYSISEDDINELYRDLHTIKGNSGSYGFELLSHHAHLAEDMLEELRHPIEVRRDNTLLEIEKNVSAMNTCMDEIHEKIKLIFGKDEEIYVRISEKQIADIQKKCADVLEKQNKSTIDNLIKACNMLNWKPLKTLMRKYIKVVQRTARKFDKNIDIIINNGDKLFPPNSLADIDDILIHIASNAASHGIEPPEVREELDKGIGRIIFDFEEKANERIVTITDDGQGIDREKLVTTCIEKNILTSQEASEVSEQDKLQLIFKSGISTANSVTTVSGRGIGMDVVMDKIKQLRGRIDVSSEVGKGTSFRITVPKNYNLERTHNHGAQTYHTRNVTETPYDF